MGFVFLLITLCDKKREHWINLKFLVKFKKKTPTECYKFSKEAYGENSLSCVCVANGINSFLMVERVPKMTNIQVDLTLFILHKQ